METNNTKPKGFIWSILSLISIFLGIVFWVITIINGTTIWMLTLLINPVGVILGVIAKKKKNPFSLFVIVGNIIMTVSFIPMIFIGYIFESLNQK